MWCEILISVIATIIGGILLAVFLFFFNEYIVPIRNLTGEWDIKTVTENTSYNPYKNMELCYKFHILQTGQSITGSGEKIKEVLSDGTITEYDREKRVISEITGYYERRFFRRDRVYLNIVENGRSRQSRTTCILTVKMKKNLAGTFTSTSADCNGQIVMTKL